MEYTELDIRLNQMDPYAEILIARLNEINFESYAEDDNGLKAYVPTKLFNSIALEEIITDISKVSELSFTISNVKQENWNALWESNYHPVFINDSCVIRAHFHNAYPDFRYEVIITPKMSFGTGHHETTSLLINEMLDLDFKDKSVLDMGCGTGILAILASKLGAVDLLGIDFDEWAFVNAKENAILNNISNINFINGDANTIGNRKFDIVLVNINRNVILSDIEIYIHAMEDAAIILLSGFLSEDIPLILNKTEQLGLQLVDSKNKNKWQMLQLKRA